LVTVTYDPNEATRKVACAPVGIPSTFIYYKWQHKSKYGVLIRELDGRTNGVPTLPSIPVEDIYQDSGEYVCIAGNGIVLTDILGATENELEQMYWLICAL
jgi:hypothetical protein